MRKFQQIHLIEQDISEDASEKCQIHKYVKQCQADCEGDAVLPIAPDPRVSDGIGQYKKGQQGIKEKQRCGKVTVKGYKKRQKGVAVGLAGAQEDAPGDAGIVRNYKIQDGQT